MKEHFFARCVIGLWVAVALLLPLGSLTLWGKETVLRVALYEEVPSSSKLYDVLQEEWNARKNKGKFHFFEWDCYSGEMPENADVVVFDAIVLKALLENNQLRELPETLMQDEAYFPFSVPPARSSGKLYCIPQMLCTYMLFLRPEDKELLAQTDLESILDIIGERKTDGIKPVGSMEGMLCCACEEFDIGSVYEYLKLRYGEKTETVMDKLVKACGFEQMKYRTEDYDLFLQAGWFAEGNGRAYMEYGESLANMGHYRNKVVIRPLLSPNTPFYGDYIAVTTHCPENALQMAYDVVRLLASPEYLEKAIKRESGEKQYLMPTNQALFQKLAKEDPIYRQMLSFVEKKDNYILMDSVNDFKRTRETGIRLYQKYQ